MRHLLIQSEDGSKGRSFRAELLAYAKANALWEIGQNADRETIRPVFCMLACSEAEAAPVIANLRMGRKAKMWEDNTYGSRESNIVFDFLKSAKYTIVPQRHPEGVAVTLYQNDMLRFDLAMVDPNRVQFVLLPDQRWLAPQQPEAEAYVKAWLALACDRRDAVPTDEQINIVTRSCYLWAKQIFARAKGPIPKDARFFSQALLAMLGAGLASFSAENNYGWNRTFGQHSGFGFETWGLEHVGMAPGIVVKATHAELEKSLAEQVEVYYKMVKE